MYKKQVRLFKWDLLHKKKKFSIKDLFSKCDHFRWFGNMYKRNLQWKTSFFVYCYIIDGNENGAENKK